MRVLFDPNVLISYLLTPNGSSPPVAIVEAALAGVFSLLMTAGVAEVRTKTATKPYLAARIAPPEVEALMRLLISVAEILPEIEEVPAVSRDRKDDYLLAHAIVGRADYLVSGDADLLSLDRVDGVAIVNPAGLLRVLRDADLV